MTFSVDFDMAIFFLLGWNLEMCTPHILSSGQWATPFKINTPPVEDLGKECITGGVNFQIQLPPTEGVWNSLFYLFLL